MKYLPISKLPVMEEEAAAGEIAETFDEIRTVEGIPSVGIANLAAAGSPATLISGTRLLHDFMERATLPPPLLFMIHYTISATRNCKCCSAAFKTACRSVGVDEEMLEALAGNLNLVNPKRAQEIIRFAVKCALKPLSLVEADYDRVRDQGVSDEELVEIIGWAALAMYNDTLADGMKFDDPERQQVIEQ
jgi:alkylhydroperoxidase family enzyme